MNKFHPLMLPLYDYNDGFYPAYGGGINYYGERREYMEFNTPVTLLSLDVLDYKEAYNPTLFLQVR